MADEKAEEVGGANVVQDMGSGLVCKDFSKQDPEYYVSFEVADGLIAESMTQEWEKIKGQFVKESKGFRVDSPLFRKHIEKKYGYGELYLRVFQPYLEQCAEQKENRALYGYKNIEIRKKDAENIWVVESFVFLEPVFEWSLQIGEVDIVDALKKYAIQEEPVTADLIDKSIEMQLNSIIKTHSTEAAGLTDEVIKKIGYGSKDALMKALRDSNIERIERVRTSKKVDASVSFLLNRVENQFVPNMIWFRETVANMFDRLLMQLGSVEKVAETYNVKTAAEVIKILGAQMISSMLRHSVVRNFMWAVDGKVDSQKSLDQGNADFEIWIKTNK